MPRARPENIEFQTAAAQQEESSGCFVFMFVPLIVILVSALLGFFAWTANPSTAAHLDSPPVSAAGISPIFRVEVRHWADSISRWAVAAGVDPNLAATVMQIESCGDPRATSSVGAMGLFQVMPFHFRALENPYDPDTNAARGLAYLAKSLASGNGNVRLALAGYNGGIGILQHGDWAWPAQTKRYVQYGAPIYEDARSGLSSSAALNQWYERYGVSLCRQASQRLGLR